MEKRNHRKIRYRAIKKGTRVKRSGSAYGKLQLNKSEKERGA